MDQIPTTDCWSQADSTELSFCTYNIQTSDTTKLNMYLGKHSLKKWYNSARKKVKGCLPKQRKKCVKHFRHQRLIWHINDTCKWVPSSCPLFTVWYFLSGMLWSKLYIQNTIKSMLMLWHTKCALAYFDPKECILKQNFTMLINFSVRTLCAMYRNSNFVFAHKNMKKMPWKVEFFKGQKIWKQFFLKLHCPKSFWRILALASKMGQNKKIKTLYTIINTP